jgi:uncharacterized membrane protein
MHKARLEAFSDGVIAIIITIMVLELKAPHGSAIAELTPLMPVFISYLISFLYVAIYWNNHHHMFQVVKHVNGATLWANIHLLFWLSLIPFVSAWSGENHFAPVPVAFYGVVLFMAAIAYFILARVLIKSHGLDSELAKALGSDFKGKLSVILYGVSIPIALWLPLVSFGIYVLLAVIWFVPDSRMEKVYRR